MSQLTTAREREILSWIIQGKTCWETGQILGISEHTVRDHIKNIYSKHDIKNRTEAMLIAREHGIVVSRQKR